LAEFDQQSEKVYKTKDIKSHDGFVFIENLKRSKSTVKRAFKQLATAKNVIKVEKETRTIESDIAK
jgi:hypothetical protein